jgi:tripartite-type tricarboxylate transporter receptor subunit TctC
MQSFRLSSPSLLWALLLCVAGAFPAQAQSWPTRPIVLVIPFAAGGPSDIVGRQFAEYGSKQLGQPIIVENKPGGGGVVAAISVSTALPDGYTILLQAVGPMILRPLMDPSVGYGAKDFSSIALVGESPNVIISGPKYSSQSLREVVEYAKKNPGKLTIGHSGIGTMGHLSALLHASNAGITATYVGYRTGTDALPDLLGGRIDLAYVVYTPQIKVAHMMAVMTAEPVDFLPGVPSMREAGFPGVYASTWYGLYGPPNLPPDILARLNRVMNDFLRSDDGRKRLAIQGFRPLGGSPEQLIAKMAEDKVRWSKVIKDANIQLTDQQQR